MKKITYTEKLHAYRLTLLLDQHDLCNKCPAGKGFRLRGLNRYMNQRYINNQCLICINFVLSRIPRTEIREEARELYDIANKPVTRKPCCPCYLLESPRQATIEALKKYYKEEV